MSAKQKPKKVTAFIIIGAVFIMIGVWMWADGIGAIRSGQMIPGGTKTKPMSGSTAVLIGSGAVGIGAYALWAGWKGKRY